MRMKKKTLLIIIALMVLLTSCQPTPEKEIVTAKDGEKLEELIRATKAPDIDKKEAAKPTPAITDTPESEEEWRKYSGILSVPAVDHWTEQVVIENKNKSVVTFDIDADIYVVEDDVYPVAKVGRKEFSEEDARKFLQYFIHDKELFEDNPRQIHPIDRMSDDIINLKQLMAFVRSTTKVEASIKQDVAKRIQKKILLNEQIIEYWNEKGKMPGLRGSVNPNGERVTELFDLEEGEGEVVLAPEYDLYTPFGYQFKQKEDGHGGYYDTYEMKARTYNDDDTSDRFSITNSKHSNYYRLGYEKGAKRHYYGETEQYHAEKQPSGMILSLEESLSIAGKVLSDLGIDHMSLAQIDIKNESKPMNLFMMYNLPHEDAFTDLLSGKQETNQCFQFAFMRDFNGVPSASGKEISKITSSSIAEDARREFDVLFPHEPEIIAICVDDTGVVSFEWHAPSVDKAIENDNVQTISLDEAKEKFLKQIRYENVWAFSDSKVTIRVDKVTKLMVKTLVENNFTEEYRYVPAYTFYGHKEMVTERLTRTEHGILVTINAIDGSIIDRSNETFS